MSVIRVSVSLLLAAGVLFAQDDHGGILQPSREGALTAGQDNIAGDSTHGRTIFEGKGACLTCHRIRDMGSRLGPDLTAIATMRTRDALEGSLIAPGPEVQSQYRLYRVVTLNGTAFTGRLLNQDTSSLQMLDSKERLLGFLKSNLREYNFVPTPPMPSYRNKLSSEELTDVIAYLASLKGVSQ